MKTLTGNTVSFVRSLHVGLCKHFSKVPTKGVQEKILLQLSLQCTEDKPLGEMVEDRAAVAKVYQNIQGLSGRERKGKMKA